MTEMLKSCPFCGGVAGVDKTNYYFEDTGEHAMSAFVVQCRSCGMKTAQYRTEDSAIKRWNRRAERTCHHARKWDGLDGHDPACSRCGHEWPRESRNRFDYSDFNYCPYCGARVVDE